MNRWSRAELRRRAVRAAAKAALLGVLACGDVPTQPLEAPTDHTPPDAGTTIAADATVLEGEDATVVAHEDATVVVHEDAAVVAHEDAAVLASADAGVADAGARCDGERASAIDAGLSEDQAWERYVACCTEVGWDWNQGCMAWGPPVPPALEVVT
ncbi:hypothetical protein L6R52_21360 [Myxococcota bacterium]|nr:hypothetical protein [Myxococcota bacterium]